MFKYKKEQKTIEINGIKIGGGNSIVLMGTIFYKEEKNRNDFNYIESLVNNTLELSEKNEIPFLLDVFIDEKDDFEKTINFTSKFKIPFLIDSPNWETRIKSFKFCKEVGLMDSVIYNSFNPGMPLEEKEELKTLRPKNALLLAFNPVNNSIPGKIETIKKKLLPVAQLSGVRNILLDSGSMPIGNKSLESIKAVIALKSNFGYPTGCGIHNIVSSWIKEKEFDKEIKNICDSSLTACQAILGADFIMYGPIESSYRVFPVIRMIQDVLNDG